jgi:hypothetical protein
MNDSPRTWSARLAATACSPEHRVRAVRRRIATALLPSPVPEALGDVRLLPHQRQAAARLHRIIDQHRGALLADAVGLGKTYTALAVARRYEHAAVLAPAGLVAMWQAALLRTGQRHITVHSLHRASMHAPPHFAREEVASADRVLVIVDEAHALRNAHTARYRHVARAVAGCDLLLLSATPLHNRADDLQALFALFRGAHLRAVHPDVLSALIVRRDRIADEDVSPQRRATPTVRVHPARTVPQDSRTLDRLLALPAPLPARDGAVAGALIRLGLLRAWCSSDAALTHALARRIQRGAAMRDALEAGRYPTPGELQSLIGEPADSDMQLGFAELLVAGAPHSPDEQRTMLDLLRRHCDALRELRDHHVANARADQVRAAYLRSIRARHPGVPVVAFSHHARTIQALFRALSDIAGVGMLTSRQARIATGPIARTELLGYFAPRAHGRPPPPPALHVSLLLTTDLIAEGVNLQDAGVVIHLDLPWTHALRTQRTGRVVRLGSPHGTVHEYRIRASPRARRVVKIERRVARKALISSRLVGGASGRSPADVRNRWTERLESWAPAPLDSPGLPPAANEPMLAVVRARENCCSALVLVRTVGVAQLLAVVVQGRSRLWVSERADALLAVSEGRWPARCPQAAGAEWTNMTMAQLRRRIRLAVHQWSAHEQGRRVSGLSTALTRASGESESESSLNLMQQQAMRWLRELVASWSAVQRQQRGHEVARARQCIAAAQGAGCDEGLWRWMRQSASAGSGLEAWRMVPELVRAMAASRVAHEGHAAAPAPARPTPGRIDACLLMVPAGGDGAR